MDYKKMISPFVLLGLFTLFVVISLMVIFSRGKKAKWIASKMKIGAAILAITGVSTGCPPAVTCYDPVQPDRFEFDQLDQKDYSIVATLPGDSVLTGSVHQSLYNNYSFKVFKDDTLMIQKGTVIAIDGLFDAPEEKFKIVLDSTIAAGIYQLDIFTSLNGEGKQDDDFVQGNRLKIN